MQIPVIFLAFANDKVDNARYLRNLPRELDGIRNALLPAVKAGLCEVVERANATIDNILDTFQDQRYRDRIAIFHYGGHADGYQLLLEELDGSHAVAYGGGLVSFFAMQKGLKLVFFNGCSTHQQSLELTQAGIPAVIGTSNAINDDVATLLAIRFYRGIAQGMTLERSWNAAVSNIKIKQSEGNTRGLYRKEAAQKLVDERFPWELLIREGAEIVKEFNLPTEVNNPLFGLPEIPKIYNLPAEPYQFLLPYTRPYAEIFFGRATYIRDLYNRITDKNSAPIICIFGQAAVGKSSLFDAGLRPRLESSHIVQYVKRKQDKGLLGTLEEALDIEKSEQEIDAERKSILEAKDSFEQKPIETLSLDLLNSLTITDANTISNEVSNNHNSAETFEGQAVEIMTETEISSQESKPSKGKDALIEALRDLSTKVDLSLQGTIFKFIQELNKEEKANNISNTPNQPSAAGTSRLLQRWKQIEEESGKPLVIILDHVEECYTRPMMTDKALNEGEQLNMGEREIEIFLQEVKALFNDLSNLPRGKLLLGYRKEYQADFEEWFKWFKLPQNKVFLENLEREEIIEIIQGLTSTENLRRNYRISIEMGLAEIIADDLLEDRESAIAPALQMILTKLWKSCENEHTRLFTIQKYQELKKQGLFVKDFLEEQMQKIREWNPEVEESGLVLDILMQHTTRFATAGMQNVNELKKLYSHQADVLGSILDKCKELFLLTDLGQSTALAHDSLAPVIQEKYRKSMYVGQRATRLLENKIVNFNPKDKKSSVFDERELGVVEEGGKGMRYWTEKELELIEASRRRRAINKRNRRWRRIGFIASLVTVIGFTIYSWILKNIASNEQIRAEASQLMTLAIQNEDMTMALRLAERADSLAMYIQDNSMKEKLIEILATGNFYTSFWQGSLANPKICLDKEGSKMLFYGIDSVLYVRDLKGNDLFKLSNQSVIDFDLSTDGRKILTLGTSDNIARLWDINGKQLATFKENIKDFAFNQLGFSPDGKYFYTLSNGLIVRVWDMQGRQVNQYQVKENKEYIYQLTFAPNSQSLLIYASVFNNNKESDFYEIRNWDIKTGNISFRKRYDEYFYRLAFSPNGEEIALASDTTLYLTNLKGNVLAKINEHEHKFFNFCFSPDGKQVITTNRARAIKFYDIDYITQLYNGGNHDLILPMRVFEESGLVDAMSIVANGKQLMTANIYNGLKFWDLQSYYKIVYGGINNFIKPVAFAPDGKEFFCMVQGDTKIYAYKTHSENTFDKEEINLTDSVYAEIHFDEKHILKVTDSIRLFDFDLRQLASIAKPENYYQSKLSQDGQRILVLGIDTIQVFNTKGEVLTTIRDTGTDVFISPNNQYIVTINDFDNGNDFNARVWDSKGKLLSTLKGHNNYINEVSFSPDGKYLATASQDFTAKIWNLSGQEVLTLAGHTQSVNVVTFSPNSNYILTGSDDYTARLWNLSGEELKTFIAHKVNSAVFSPDGKQILTAGTQDFNQKDYFNISKKKKTSNFFSMSYSEEEELSKDKYMVSAMILWDINQDQKTWLHSPKIANFALTDYLVAGASIPYRTLISLDNAYELNTAGFYYLQTDVPISGVPKNKRLDYAKNFFEKSLKIERTYYGVVGLAEVGERQKGEFEVELMTKTNEIEELSWYMDYIYANKLKVAKNRTDSLEYWKGLKKIAERSLEIRQTPQALNTLQSANYVLKDKANIAMVLNNSLNDMRKYADFFREQRNFRKLGLLQATQVYEHILRKLKPTSEDYKNAIETYSKLAWYQLLDREVVEAEKSVNRGLEINALQADKSQKYLYLNQLLVYVFTNRYEEARAIYQRETRNDQLPDGKSFRVLVKEDIDKLEKAGLVLDRNKVSWVR